MSRLGDAVCVRHSDGTVTVTRADPLIQVTPELLENCESWAWDGVTLQLDTAGEYRYRRAADWPVQQYGVLVFERI